MGELSEVAPAFIEMAHQIVWCTAATVDRSNRPRVRILHPIWTWNDETITGWIATSPTPTKRAHLANSAFIACNYWSPSHDTCLAECNAEWMLDDDTRTMAWELFANGPEPVALRPERRAGMEHADIGQIRGPAAHAVAVAGVPGLRPARPRRQGSHLGST